MNHSFTPPAAARLQEIPQYIFARINTEIAAVEKQSGRKALNLGAGNPDVPPSHHAIDAYSRFLHDENSHSYPGYKAIPEFAEALLHHYKQRFGVTLQENELLPLNGGKDGIAHLPVALFNKNEEVLVPDPGYPAFTTPAELVGAKPITYSLHAENGFKLNLQEIKKKLSPLTRYIWVNFPSNPTGSVATIDELKQLVEFARNNNIFILYDNAYAEITFDGFQAPSILQIDGAKDIAVEIGSFSKSHSFAGYRMGWIVGNSEIIARLGVVKSQLDSGLSIPLQKLGADVLTNPDIVWQTKMIESYKHRRDIIGSYLHTLGLTYELPKGGLYIWAKIPGSAPNCDEFCMNILKQKQIVLTPGSAYGKQGERYVRASFCAAIDNVEEYFKS